jgi:uncharacterized protein DUF4190
MSVPGPQTSTTAVLSLVFGIVCWIGLPLLGAIVAVVCGHLARGEIRRAPPESIHGAGLALAGLILGYLQLALLAVMAFGIVLVLLGVLSYSH